MTNLQQQLMLYCCPTLQLQQYCDRFYGRDILERSTQYREPVPEPIKSALVRFEKAHTIERLGVDR